MDRSQSSMKDKIGREGRNQQSQKDCEYPGIDVAEPLVRLSVSEKSTTKEAYLNKEVPQKLYDRKDRFKGVPNFSGYRAEKTDFSDVEWANEPAVTLCALKDVSICQLGMHVFSMLSLGVSRQDLGALLLLAFQLKVPGVESESRVFPEVVDGVFKTVNDLTYEELEPRRVSIMNTEVQPVESGDPGKDAKSYSFLAASMLRMFNKSPENYSKAWTHICEGYQSFYIHPISVTGISLNLAVLKTIHRQFAADPLMRSTLFRILYHTNETDKYEGIQNFLYKLHLSYTGMHIVSMFMRLWSELKCSSGLLLSCFLDQAFDAQIQALATLLGYVGSSEPKRRRQMWIYGRIFDQDFMSSLQTRNCPRFVYILAAALKMERPRANAGILQIRQLQKLSSADKKRCNIAAENLIMMVRSYLNKGQKGMVLDVFSLRFDDNII